MAKQGRLISLKKRILIYTAVPVSVIIIIAAIFSVLTVRNMISDISCSEISFSTALANSRVENLMDEYGSAAMSMAGDESIKNFLRTADDRDAIDENPYFSHTMGKLDSTVTSYSSLVRNAWLVSAAVPNIAFSNSSLGWRAADDFDFTNSEIYSSMKSEITSDGYFFTDPYNSSVTGQIEISVLSPVRDTRSNILLGYCIIDINPMSFWNKISAMPEKSVNEIYIQSGNDRIIFHSDINRVYTNFGYLRMTEVRNNGTDFIMNGRLLTGTKGSLKNSRWTIYSLRDTSEMNGLIKRYTKITAGIFGTVLLILIAAISAGSERIAKPLQSYTKMINEYRLDDDDSESSGELLTPSGCTETAHLALSFNDLIGRYRSLLGEMKDMNIRLEKEQKLYQTALQSSSDVIFEYDIDTDALITYGSLFDSTADKTVENLHSEFVKSVMEEKKYRALSQDDAVKFFNGCCENSVVISRTGEDGSIHWVSFEGTPLLSNGKPVKIVGKLSLIDDMMNLKEVAEREPFSGLYNKTATERLISDKLSDNIYGAMLIIDIDNFKNVNDRLGHAIGDEVIKNVVNKINSVINPADIAGRIGGDEFMIYAANADESSAAKLCESLCGIIKSDVSSGDITVSISASIGAAVSPVHGKTFDELYRCADIAMYVTKCGGKDNFTVYDDQERPEYHGRTSDM